MEDDEELYRGPFFAENVVNSTKFVISSVEGLLLYVSDLYLALRPLSRYASSINLAECPCFHSVFAKRIYPSHTYCHSSPLRWRWPVAAVYSTRCIMFLANFRTPLIFKVCSSRVYDV